MAENLYIESRENERIKHLCRLASTAALRQEEGVFFAEGTKLCLDLAQAVPPVEVYYTEQILQKEPRIAKLSGKHFIITERVAAKLATGKTAQGLFCLFSLPASWNAKIDSNSRILVLDGVQDPGNVGAALRSAAAFGWDAAVLGEGCADPFSPKALRSGMSATLKLPILKTERLQLVLRTLQQNGCLCMAARLEEAEEMHRFSVECALALVIGSEGQGVRQEIAQTCQKSVYIPIAPQMESLNAAVAAGVLMYYFRAY